MKYKKKVRYLCSDRDIRANVASICYIKNGKKSYNNRVKTWSSRLSKLQHLSKVKL